MSENERKHEKTWVMRPGLTMDKTLQDFERYFEFVAGPLQPPEVP